MKRLALLIPALLVACSVVVDVERFNKGGEVPADSATARPDSESANDSAVDSAVSDAADGSVDVKPRPPPQVFIAGGNSEMINVTTVVRGQIVDGAIAGWTVLGDRLSASASATQATRSGRNVFILGPDFNTVNLHTVRFASFDADGALSSWAGQKGAFTPHARVAAASTAKFLYVIGGIEAGTDAKMSSVYAAPINEDGSPGTFVATKPLPVPRSGACAVVVDDNLFVFGGSSTATASLRTSVRAKIGVDGTLGDWQSQSDTTNTTDGCSAIAFGRRVYVLGGYGAQDAVQYATVSSTGELGTFTSGAKMLSQHAYYQAVVAGGYVVVAGGFGAMNASSDLVEIAPISETGIGTWKSAAKLPAPRHFVNAFGYD